MSNEFNTTGGGGTGGGGGPPMNVNAGGESIANPWQQFQLQQQQQFQQAQQQQQFQQQQQQQPFILGGGGGLTTVEVAAWRERERRQRSVRVLMMFLLMLFLMDEDNNNNNRDYKDERSDRLRGGRGSSETFDRTNQRGTRRYLHSDVYVARQANERSLRHLALGHARYQSLVSMNGGIDCNGAVKEWSATHVDMVRDEFFSEQPDEASMGARRAPTITIGQEDDARLGSSDAEAASHRVWHYPWNTTGFYRGDWHRVTEIDELMEAGTIRRPPETTANTTNIQYTPKQLEETMLEELRNRQQVAALIPLPMGMEFMEISSSSDASRSNESGYKRDPDDPHTVVRRGTTETIGDPVSSSRETSSAPNPTMTLTRDDGRAAFQLFTKSIAGLSEVSLISGLIKLYDSTAAGYSTRKDVLLRVRGVLLHSIGRVSLVANVATNAVALVLDEKSRDEQPIAISEKQPIHTSAQSRSSLQRRLQRLAAKASRNESIVDQIRSDALQLEHGGGLSPSGIQKTVDVGVRSLTDSDVDPWSNVVIPYPFVRDDQYDSVRNARTPASRTMPEREQALEANAADCIFEINLDVTPVEWTIGDWRKLVVRRVEEEIALNPANAPEPSAIDSESTQVHTSRRRTVRTTRRVIKKLPDQALVMNMVGTIHSCNCNFTAFVNTTALRTDWDATTSKAINYSFYMMIVCLTQILILLRQLLHSQSQSTATRVSLLCIGWQTIIDALVCLAHIYLSLAVQPLFTAFASVAFFKLLIFCVIEMKYMAIIIQARNSSNGGQPTDVLRHQVAMLHLRFYGSLMATFLILFYAHNKYRVFYMLALYSFWVPQIVLNIITEAKTPLHKYYIYGMSITRMFAPLYIFGIRNNFLKEVYPESATEPFMCQMLVLWVACQTAILIAQGKYGARFMIPARFLPPKFDYCRPIPASMLPPGALVDLPTPELMEDRDDSLRGESPSKRDELDCSIPEVDGSQQPRALRHQTAETTRNRLKGSRNAKRACNGGASMTTEELISTRPQATPTPVLECSICYDDIDIRDRKHYMLAPCNHLYHAECLKQWMDVKMECPICRTELPAL